MKRTRVGFLASLLCMALIFTDVMPTGLVSQAAEISQQVFAMTEVGEGNELTSEETTGEEKDGKDISENGASEEEQESEMSEEEEPTSSEDPTDDETEEQDPSEDQTDTEDGETGEEAEMPEDEKPEEETEDLEISAPEEDEIEETEEPETVEALTADGDEGEIIAQGTYPENTADTEPHTEWVLYKSGKLVVTGTGEVKYTYQNSPWYEYRDKIITAKINVDGMTNAYHLFADCSNLKSVDITDTSKVTDMGSMFSGCVSLEKLDLSGWDTGAVTNMSWMFYDCENLTTLDASKWDTSQIMNMSYMFYDCESLETLNLSGWDTGKVTDMSWMFKNCKKLAEPNLSGWSNTGAVMDMSLMFEGCESLKTLDLSGWDTGKVTNIMQMFYGCSSLTELNLSGWDTGAVMNMHGTFWHCQSLTNLDLSGWDNTGKVTDMSYMFYNCDGLTELDLSGWDANAVTDMSNMFSSSENLKEVNLSGWGAGAVTDMSYMFYADYDLERVVLDGWNPGAVENMNWMFGFCYDLSELDLSGWDTGKVTGVQSMLYLCNKLEVICAPLNLKKSVALPRANNKDVWYRADNGNKLTELPKGLPKSILLVKNKQIDAQGYIVARKGKTDYLCNETVNTNDITVIHYNGEGKSKVHTKGFTTNVEEIDMSCPGIKDLVVTYVDSDTEANPEKTLTATVKLTVTYGLSKENVEITLQEGNSIYNGYPQRPKPIVSVRTSGSDNADQASESKKLIEGADYRVSYDNDYHINAGEQVEVIVTGTGDYSQTVSKTFTIAPAELTIQAGDATLAVGADLPEPELLPYKAIGLATDDRLEVVDYTFTKQSGGSAVNSKDVTSEQGIYFVKLQVDAGDNYKVNSLEGKLTIAEEGVAYTVFYEMMGHDDEVILPRTGIKAGSLIDEPKAPEAKGYVFTGWYKDKTFAAKHKWNFDTDTVQADTTLYACWLEKGTKAEDGSELQFFIQDIQKQYYTGSAIKPTVYVYAADGVTLLKSGKDYTIKYANNTNVPVNEKGESTDEGKGGTAMFYDSGEIGKKDPDINIAGTFSAKLPYVIITGKGNYKGTICKNFQILPVDISTDDGSVAAEFTLKYSDQLVTNTKKTQNPFSSLKYKKAMKLGTDYEITLTAGDDVLYDAKVGPDESWSANGNSAPTTQSADGKKYIAPTIPRGYYGTFKMTVAGKGNYSGIFTKEVKVTDKKHLMKNASVTLGKNQKSRTLKENQLTPGYCTTVTVGGKKKTLYYSVDRSGTWGPDEADTKNIFLVKAGGEYLIYGVDYKVSYTNNKAIGTATMTITGMGEYMGTKSVTFKITGTAFNAKNVVVKTHDAQKPDEKDAFITSISYTGKAITQNNVLLTNGKTEDEYREFAYGTDYIISYKNNIKKGTATMTFTAKPESGYSGSFKKTFKIEAQSLVDVKFSEEGIVGNEKLTDNNTKTMTWNGETPAYSKNGATLLFTLKNEEGMELKQGTDYTVSYKNNKAVAEITAEKQPTLTIKGKGNYAGALTVIFPIKKANIETAWEEGTLTVSATSVARKGNMKFKDFKFKVLDGKKTMSEGTGKDYTINLEECDDATIQKYADALTTEGIVTTAKKPTVRIEGTVNYEGTKEISLAEYIYVTKLTSKNITIEVTGDKTYIGSNGKVEPTVEVTYYPNGKNGDGSVILIDKEDYELSYGTNNTAGKNRGSVTVTGKGIYGGSVTQKFNIQSKDVYSK